MARPRAKELTERELEVMHVFWKEGELTAVEVRNLLAAKGRDLAYTTVATLVRLVAEKGFLKQTSNERPFTYKPVRTFEDVSGNMISDLISRVFDGSREQLLVRLLVDRNLTDEERQVLEAVLREEDP